MEASKKAKREAKKTGKQTSKKTSKKRHEDAEATLPQLVTSENGVEQEEVASGKVKFKGTMQHDEALHYLEAILNGLRKGKLQFKQGDERVALEPGVASVRVEVRAERKSAKEKLSLELSWHTGTEQEEKLEVD